MGRDLGQRPVTTCGGRPQRITTWLTLLVAGTLAATCGSPNPTATGRPEATGLPSATTTVPTATAGVSPAPTSEPAAASWSPLDVASLPEVATLEATRTGASAVAPDTAFRLTSLDGTSVRTMAAHLVVTPVIKLVVAKAAGDTATLQPSAPLRTGQVYRFELRREDGTTAAAWAVQAAWPLGLASTVPSDAATDVPRDTGVEIEFDQDGVRMSDFQDHFSIQPTVVGRFEQHQRTFVFVPTQPLKASTLYTVTIRHGLLLPGTGMTLGHDAVVAFETTGGTVSRAHVVVSRPLFDAGTHERPAVGILLDYPDENAAKVRKVNVTVHRLPGLAAATQAYRQVRSAPDWTERSSTAPVPTTSLPVAMKGSLPVTTRSGDEWQGWIRLPAPLPAGWYVVTIRHAGLARQAVIQVSDLAVYSMVSITRTLLWVNDLGTNGPVSGATIALGGRSFGTTNAKGLRVAATPAPIVDDARDGVETLAVIRSGTRALFLPLASQHICWGCGVQQGQAWWHLLSTDRGQYRVSDTINVWGVLRNRDSGAVPASADVRLSTSADTGVAPSAVTKATIVPDRSGAWVAHLSFTDLPPGRYVISVLVSGKVVADTEVTVGPIAKPAWQLDLSTPHRAVLSGSKVPLAAIATFFEGTPVAGATLRLEGSDEASEDDGGDQSPPAQLATTDATGAASGTVTVKLGTEATDQWSILWPRVTANEPEEATISAEVPVAVFRSTAILDATPTLKGTTLTISGAVHDVAFGAFDEPAPSSLWDVDPRGAPRAGVNVTLHVTELISVLHQTGTQYDFIAKRSMPVYRVTERRVDLGTRTVKTGTDGTFRVRRTVTGGDHRYEVVASYADAGGRWVEARDSATQDVVTPIDSGPRLVGPAGSEGYGEYRQGETVAVRFRGGIAHPEVARYLFTAELRGIRDISVQAGAKYTMRFSASLLPAASITAVRFNGTGYEVARNDFSAFLRLDDRTVDVQLTPDQQGYAPGGHVTVAIRTLDATGRPVAASVFIRAVDEKLFAIGAASEDDPLSELYANPGSGVLAVSWSHAAAAGDGKGEGGDTTGGGGDAGRSDFRDWLTAQLVTTGADGRASVSFDLSDDLTSWRVLASAVTQGLGAGRGSVSIPVSLPFFADVVVAPEYLTVDRPLIRVRAYGTGLTAADDVTFTASSDTLSMAPVTAHGKAFQAVEITLPPLASGTQRVRVVATTGSGASRRQDVLTRTFQVVDSRAVQRHTVTASLTPGLTIGGADGLTTVTLSDAGRGRVVPLLLELAAGEPYRADSALAASIARAVLADGFGIPDEPGLPEADLQGFQAGGGVALLPYSSVDLELSAMAAFSGDPHLNLDDLRGYFGDQEAGQPSGQQMFVLLGRASLGLASIADVTAAAARADLAPIDRVTVALAAVALGDMALARRLERDLLSEFGRRLGPWVRLEVGSAEDQAVATARLAIVAAAIGDPLAADMDAEVAAHPPLDTLVDLERALAARYWAATTPTADAVAAVTLGGSRTEVAITASKPVVLRVTPAQRAGTRIDPVSGSVLVTSDWDGPLAAGDLTAASGQSITRTVSPAGAIGSTDTVAVTFSVKLGSGADDGCWRVTDFAPSGLAPIAVDGQWYRYEDDQAIGPSVIAPWQVVGQRVDFCVSRDPKHPTQTLRYLARVVSSGAYRWESAVLQSEVVPEQGIVLPAFDITIRGLGS